MRTRAGAVDFAEQVFEIRRVGDKVDIRAVHHEQRRFVVVEEKIPVRRGDALEILEADMALEGAIALAEALGKYLDISADVYYQLGFCELSIQQPVNALV